MVMKSASRGSRAEHARRAQEHEPAAAGRSSRTGNHLYEAHVDGSNFLGGTRFAQHVSPRREMHHCPHSLQSARQIRRTDVLPAEGNYVVAERTQGRAKMPSYEARGAGYCNVAHAA